MPTNPLYGLHILWIWHGDVAGHQWLGRHQNPNSAKHHRFLGFTDTDSLHFGRKTRLETNRRILGSSDQRIHFGRLGHAIFQNW